MDETERLAEMHLRHRGYQTIEYEPDGNVPPDFLVDGRIAVEVRRLNQHFFEGEKPQGLESLQIAMWNKVKQIGADLGPPHVGEMSWFYSVSFRRPVEPLKTLYPKIKNALREFMDRPNRSEGTLRPAENVTIDLVRASSSHPTFFVMGGQMDNDSGGWLLAELEQNLRLCIHEKSLKIAQYKSRYPEWWLVLVDHISYGLDDIDIEMFRDSVSITHEWNKVVLVAPRDHTRYIEI